MKNPTLLVTLMLLGWSSVALASPPRSRGADPWRRSRRTMRIESLPHRALPRAHRAAELERRGDRTQPSITPGFQDRIERLAELYDGVGVATVEAGSLTARAGVQPGDVLLAVNGQRLHRVADYPAARALDARELRLEVVRNGRTLHLSVPIPPAQNADNTDSSQNRDLNVGWTGRS